MSELGTGEGLQWRLGALYLEVGSPLEGLAAHGAHVDALPAVRVLAVVQQQSRRCEAAATLQAWVLPALLLRLAAWGQVSGDVSYLRWVRDRDFTQGCSWQTNRRQQTHSIGTSHSARRVLRGLGAVRP